MVIEAGDKLHVMFRRRFEGELRRHFIGEVLAVSDSVVKVAGYAYIFNESTACFEEKPDKRVRIISLVDASVVINFLPVEASVDDASYTTDDTGRLVVTDGKNFTLDVNEFGAYR